MKRERNLDIYGSVKTEEALGEKNLIPFRFQGQYEDEETGLKRGRPYSNAVSSKEVLVEGRVPANKLTCLLYTSPSPRDRTRSRMPSSA